MTDEQGYQQRRSAMVQIGRPHHLVPASELKNTGHELQQACFIIGDSLGEQTVSVSINHNAVMMGFAGVNTGP